MLISQMAKDGKINIVIGKGLSILGHAELFEPVLNLLHRGHQGPSWPERGLNLGDGSLHRYVSDITCRMRRFWLACP